MISTKQRARVLLSLFLIVAFIGAAWAQGAEDPCTAAVRYAPSPDVAVPAEPAEVAPADLPGTSSSYDSPDILSFGLTGHPALPAGGGTETVPLDPDLWLGVVDLDRRTGLATLDGVPLTDRTQTDAHAACESAITIK